MDHLYLLMAALAGYGLWRRQVAQAVAAVAAAAVAPLGAGALVAAKEAMEVLTAAVAAVPELKCLITLWVQAEVVERTAELAEREDQANLKRMEQLETHI